MELARGFAGRGGYVEKVRVESNGGDGISTGSACLVSGSTANFNAGSGITTGNHCTVSGNTAAGNRLYGIFAAQSTVKVVYWNGLHADPAPSAFLEGDVCICIARVMDGLDASS